jgi:hypothetical protein
MMVLTIQALVEECVTSPQPSLWARQLIACDESLSRIRSGAKRGLDPQIDRDLLS